MILSLVDLVVGAPEAELPEGVSRRVAKALEGIAVALLKGACRQDRRWEG